MNRFTLLLASSLLLLPQKGTADTLHTSRFIQRISIYGETVSVAPVERAVLVEYCSDADGCKVSLKMTDTSIQAKSTRLYLPEENSALGLQWFSEDSPSEGTHRDNDGNAHQVLNLWDYYAGCSMGDFDAGAADSAVGFAISGYSSPFLTTTCTLVVED